MEGADGDLQLGEVSGIRLPHKAGLDAIDALNVAVADASIVVDAHAQLAHDLTLVYAAASQLAFTQQACALDAAAFHRAQYFHAGFAAVLDLLLYLQVSPAIDLALADAACYQQVAAHPQGAVFHVPIHAEIHGQTQVFHSAEIAAEVEFVYDMHTAIVIYADVAGFGAGEASLFSIKDHVLAGQALISL